MSPTPLSTFLERNAAYVENEKHTPLPTLEELTGQGHDFETNIVLTCCDNRVEPEKFLGLNPLDFTLVIRNTGGRVEFAMKDIMLFSAFMKLKSVIVIHHTNCGASHFKDDIIRDTLFSRHPDHPEVKDLVFGAFEDLEQSVRDDLKLLKSSPFVSKELADNSYGLTYNIKTGRIARVEE